MIPILTGVQAGRERILRARTEEGKGIPPALSERIRDVFGNGITPEQAVAKILDKSARAVIRHCWNGRDGWTELSCRG